MSEHVRQLLALYVKAEIDRLIKEGYTEEEAVKLFNSAADESLRLLKIVKQEYHKAEDGK